MWLKKLYRRILHSGCAAVLIGMSHAGAAPWDGDPVPLQAVEVQVAARPGDRLDWQGLARDFLALKSGDRLTQDRLERALDDLKTLAHVRSTVETQPEGAKLTVTVQPYQRVKSIAIQGAYPLFESDIRKLIAMAPGDLFRPQSVKEQTQRIVKRYLAEGYIDPQAAIKWEQNPEQGGIRLFIRIDKGEAYRLGGVTVTGNRALSGSLIKGRMTTWRQGVLQLGLGRLVHAALETDIQKLVAFYRRQGFLDVHITYQVDRNPNEKKIHARVSIDEGPRYVIAFSGNRFFDEADLQESLAIFDRDNRNNVGMRRSVQSIRRRYLRAGFADVQLRLQMAPDKARERQALIDIQEGARHIVSLVSIGGNRSLSEKAIKGQMLTRPPGVFSPGPYVASILKEDVAAVNAIYRQSGYHHAQVSPSVTIDEQTHQVRVILFIDEGPQTRIGKIEISGQPEAQTRALRAKLPITTNAVFLPKSVQEGENLLAGNLAAEGYPHVQVRAEIKVSADHTKADIIYRIDPGPFVKLGHIYWMGNFRTRDSLVARRIGLAEETPFSLKQVLAAQRRLRALGLFQAVQVRSIGLKEKADRVHLLVTMVEKQPYFIELGAGFQTDKGLYGRTRGGDRNFLGLNKDLQVGGEVSEVGYRWEAGLVEPSLLETQISADLALYTEREEAFNQDFGTDIFGGKLTLSRPLGRYFAVTLGIRYEQREQFLRETDAGSTDVDPATLETRDIWVTTPAIRFDSRDSFLRPRKGILTSLSADISRGLDGSVDNFIKYKLDLRVYKMLQPRLVLAGRALAGYIEPSDEQIPIPEDQLFFLGGTVDVRGFEENLLRFDADQDPVGGRLAMAAGIEARYQLNPNWELALFVDGGAIQKPLSDDGSNDNWRWTYGAGLRYQTPIGPIGLLYGRKFDPQPGESGGAFHFSMGYTF